jgi:hypothetical protein
VVYDIESQNTTQKYEETTRAELFLYDIESVGYYQ